MHLIDMHLSRTICSSFSLSLSLRFHFRYYFFHTFFRFELGFLLQIFLNLEHIYMVNGASCTGDDDENGLAPDDPVSGNSTVLQFIFLSASNGQESRKSHYDHWRLEMKCIQLFSLNLYQT